MFGRNKELKQVDLEVFTIYDSKVESYEIPSFAINQHDLIRQIINMFKDPAQKNNKFLLNAEDYSIFKLGDFNKKTGSLQTCNLQHVANLHDLRAVALRDAPSQPTVQDVINELRSAFNTQQQMERSYGYTGQSMSEIGPNSR